ncbi:quinolinate synthase NadA, partial [Methanothrix sp.]
MNETYDTRNEILILKEEHNATILAHNYQKPEVQDVADLVGDSLELSRAATSLDTEVIIFCGVDFMAETAAILSPQKRVVLPEKDAWCPMAH